MCGSLIYDKVDIIEQSLLLIQVIYTYTLSHEKVKMLKNEELNTDLNHTKINTTKVHNLDNSPIVGVI